MKRLLAGTALLCSLAAVTAMPAQATEPTWQQVGLPFLWPSAAIADVTALGQEDVWIAGVQGAFCVPQIGTWGCSFSSDGNPVARRWTGTAWQEYPLPGFTGNGPLTMVSATAPDDVWIAAPMVSPQYLARFDGTAFTQVAPPPDTTYLRLSAGKAGTWLAASRREGGQDLYRREGDAWVRTVPATLTNVTEVRARTATDAWAIGAEPYGIGTRGAIARWDGQAWQRIEHPGTKPFLDSTVLPVSATEAWLVPNRNENVIWRWDGADWSRVDGPAGAQLLKLTVDGTGTVWAGGQETVNVDGSPRRRPVLMHHTGGQWQRVTLAMPWGANEMSVADLTTAPGTGSVWVAANTNIGPRVFRQR
ncbi:hypothetical protein [Actinomadura sp. 9N407]|uniref:hypothetical protein n=1 Tax=Actinomadura sp. 9N407 TaxID=3375154 RepID=UPI0037A68C90